ncbi:MAG: DUF5597 domain-containing protein [Silvibacterium sp.]|nr:DUF5597 domain-containing protein [Silvibacterium sp.]
MDSWVLQCLLHHGARILSTSVGTLKFVSNRVEIELAPDDFIVMGTGFDVTFREMNGPLCDAQLISLDEGTFQGDKWTPPRRLNGDERHVSLPDRSTILRVHVAR